MDNDEEKQLLFELSKRIKHFRKIKGVTQEEAYNDTGIHFARIEQGKRDISYTTLCRVCKYLETNKQNFFSY